MKNYVIGLDLGGTNIRAAAVTRGGEILHRVKIPTEVANGRERVIANILKVIDKIKTQWEKEITSAINRITSGKWNAD